jgi:hypothetical protein
MIALASIERDAVIIACAISAGIHAALTPSHFAEGAGAGVGFLASAVLLALLVVVLRRRETGAALLAAIVVLTGLIGSYALAITSGFPFFHPEPESVTGLALITKSVEIAGALVALHLLWRGRPTLAVTNPQLKGRLS